MPSPICQVSSVDNVQQEKCGWEFVMYSVFGDESQDETKRRVFTLSGIFGSTEEWDSLADAWSIRTGGRIFHATDCESDQGEFSNTPHEGNQKLYADLTKLLTKTNMLGHTVSINLAAYRQAFPKNPDPLDPYYFCFHEVVFKFVTVTFLAIPQDKVEFTFDHNIDVEYNAAALYDRILHLPEWKGKDLLAKQINFAFRENPRIQAADLIAREGMKDIDNRIGPVQRPRRKSMEALVRTKRFAFMKLDSEFFRALREKAHLLKDLPGARMEKYRSWLKQNGLIENTSNRIRYQNYIDALERMQRPAQRQ